MTSPDYQDDYPARENPRSRSSYDDYRGRDYARQQDDWDYREPSYRQREREYRSYEQPNADYRTSRQPERRSARYSDEAPRPRRQSSGNRQRASQPARSRQQRNYEGARRTQQRAGTQQRISAEQRRRAAAANRQTRARQSDVYVGRTPSAGDRVADTFSSVPWLRWVVAAVALLLVIFVVVNIVSCIGGAVSGGQTEASSTATEESTTSESASSSESSSASEQASEQGVVSPWTESGYFSTGDSELDNYIKKMCDDHSTEGETFDKNAYATFIWLSQDTDYVERAENQSPYGVGWDAEYAKQFFEKNNSGNCFNFVAVAQYMLRYFGYSDAEAQPCVVELESGNWGDHGLVFLTNKVDGKRCLVDVALSSDGWMLDINAYNYDIRNIEQNPTVKGNSDVIDDGPTTIAPGNLTE